MGTQFDGYRAGQPPGGLVDQPPRLDVNSGSLRMSNSTFTWTATGASATPWTTTADWSPNPVPGNFTAPPGIGPSSDFVINGSNSLDLTGFGGGNQSVDGLTVTDANAALHFTGSPITIANVAMSSGTFVATSDGGQLTIGNANSAGTRFQLSGTFIGRFV